MKLLFVLASLFTAATCNVNVSTPRPGATLVRGKQFTVQLIEAPSVKPADAIQEIDYFVGIVSCGSSACPAPAADMGNLLSVGTYTPQGIVGNPPFPPTFQNLTLSVPSNFLIGKASVQVQRVVFIASPGEASTSVEYGSVEVRVAA